ncbi:MAG: lipopolysaccharide heptosyltransferase II [Acidobacteria bacterium]|nr:lipopolysaccharide heptosyltransferase II [Acidobacteriota bacterium]
MKIVVRGTNWVGDAVMTIPALRSLRVAFPHAEIVLLTRSWAEGVFRDADFIDRIITFDATPSKRRDLASQRRLLRGEDFDIAVLFTNSFESALAVSLARIPRRIGYAKEGRGILLTDAIPIPEWKNERHEVQYYLNLVRETVRLCDGGPFEFDESTALPIAGSRRQAAIETLRNRGIDRSKPLIAFGAGSTNSNAKRWPATSYARLNDLLKTRLDAEVILLGTRDEVDVAAEVAGLSDRRPLILSGETGLAEAAAILSVCDLVVSNDMGLAHLAPAVGAKTLVIFGPTNDRTTRPIGSEIIRKPFDCAPCMLRECPIDHRCMTSITPEEVFAKAVQMLGTNTE